MFFSYDPSLTSHVRTVPGAKYSNTFRCWHVDDNEDSIKQIFIILREFADIDISQISSASETARIKSVPAEVPVRNEEPVSPSQKNEATETVKVKNTVNPDAEGEKKQSSPTPRQIVTGSGWKRYGPVEFTIDEAFDKLIIKFTGRFDQEWIKEIRSFGRARFDAVRLEWELDWSRLAVDSLSDYFSTQGVDVIVKKLEVAPAVRGAREEQGDEIRARELDKETMTGVEKVRIYLKEKRYSIKTVETYTSVIILFFKYFIPKKPADLTENDISDFFNDYVIFHKYSASFQNQVISGIKIYFRLNGLVEIDSSVFGRPRKKRTLPKVFSKDEVKSILNSTRNMKHRLLLWMIYSCGLRRSEVTNIKLTDLDRERSILNIREAKGKVDRFVPVSPKVWDKIDEYLESYQPVFWLFEGQSGGRYSSESVYGVFKHALKSSGIKKEVGVHSLRHSYATHLHENGLDIRYIQELLGHKSTRTTEIYTHVSRRNLIAVRSPIDDLDLK